MVTTTHPPPAPPSEDYLLDILRRQYLQLLTPTDIDLTCIPAQLLLTCSFQHRLYAEVFNRNRNEHQRPPQRYTARVLKRVIHAIEEAAFAEGYGCPEIDDSLIDFYATLLSTGTPTPTTLNSTSLPSRALVTYTITPPTLIPTTIPPKTISLLESRSIISTSGHTGSRTWEAALALAELLISSSQPQAQPQPHKPPPPRLLLPPNASILELGAGTGLLSILCAHLGAAHVLATDGDWRVCAALEENVQGNGVGGVVRVGRLLWGSGRGVEAVDDGAGGEGDGDGELEGGGVGDERRMGNENGIEDEKHNNNKEKGYIIPIPKLDLILAADVTYDTPSLPPLATELKYLLTTHSHAHATALVAATVRNEDTFQSFLAELEEVGGLVVSVERWTPLGAGGAGGERGERVLWYGVGTEIRMVWVGLRGGEAPPNDTPGRGGGKE